MKLGVGGIPWYLGNIYEFCIGVFFWDVLYLRTNNQIFCFNFSHFPPIAHQNGYSGSFLWAIGGKWLKSKKIFDYLSLGKNTSQRKTPLQNLKTYHHTSYPYDISKSGKSMFKANGTCWKGDFWPSWRSFGVFQT